MHASPLLYRAFRPADGNIPCAQPHRARPVHVTDESVIALCGARAQRHALWRAGTQRLDAFTALQLNGFRPVSGRVVR